MPQKWAHSCSGSLPWLSSAFKFAFFLQFHRVRAAWFDIWKCCVCQDIFILNRLFKSGALTGRLICSSMSPLRQHRGHLPSALQLSCTLIILRWLRQGRPQVSLRHPPYCSPTAQPSLGMQAEQPMLATIHGQLFYPCPAASDVHQYWHDPAWSKLVGSPCHQRKFLHNLSRVSISLDDSPYSRSLN